MELLPEGGATALYLAAAVGARAQQLRATLAAELSRPALRRTAIRATIQLILRLGDEDVVRGVWRWSWLVLLCGAGL